MEGGGDRGGFANSLSGSRVLSSKKKGGFSVGKKTKRWVLKKILSGETNPHGENWLGMGGKPGRDHGRPFAKNPTTTHRKT